MSSIFIKIIKGEEKAYKVFENDLVIIILAREQIRPGHCLIIPKIEFAHFSNLPQLYLYEIHFLSQKLSIALQKATNCVRVGALFAGWDINHVHYHLVPMHAYDDLDHTLAKSLPEEEMIGLQNKITSELKNVIKDEKRNLQERDEIKFLKDYLKQKEKSLKKQNSLSQFWKNNKHNQLKETNHKEKHNICTLM